MAVAGDDDVTSNRAVRQLEDRIRELERHLGRKTLERSGRDAEAAVESGRWTERGWLIDLLSSRRRYSQQPRVSCCFASGLGNLGPLTVAERVRSRLRSKNKRFIRFSALVAFRAAGKHNQWINDR